MESRLQMQMQFSYETPAFGVPGSGWLIVNFRFIEAHWGSIVGLSPSQSLCHSVSESKKMKLHNVGQSGPGFRIVSH